MFGRLFRFPSVVMCCVALALWCCTAVAPAHAHDRMVDAKPAKGAVLNTAPTTGSWKFSAVLIPKGAAISVTDPAGKETPARDVAIDGPMVTATFPPVTTAGKYKLTWRVVSSDGHPISGTYQYSVTAKAVAGATPAEPTADASPTTTAAPAESTPTAATEPSDAATDTADSSAQTSSGFGMVGLLPIGAVVLVVVIGVVVWRVRTKK